MTETIDLCRIARPIQRVLVMLDFPTDPGMLDVQVIEHMYGTSTDTNLGDTTYSFADKEFSQKLLLIVGE